MVRNINERGIDMNEQRDWMVHCVIENGLSFHTHDAERYCGWELELNLSLRQEQGTLLLNTVVDYCKDKCIDLKDGMELTGVFSVPVRLVEMSPVNPHRMGERVLRMIVPDANGKFPQDVGCDPAYKNQINGRIMN